jgi:hypothetical protein
MANDPKMDQSVMISFDELDDIGAGIAEESQGQDEALNQLGINKTTGGQRPIPAARPVHVQQLSINEPKKSNALLYVVLGLCGVGLVAGGVILGGHLNPNGLQPSQAMNSQVSPTQGTPVKPAPSDAVKALLAQEQAEADKVKAEAEAKAKAKAQAEADAKAKAQAKAEAEAKAAQAKSKRSAKRSSKRSASKRSAAPAPEPKAAPAPEPAPTPKPQKSEAASLLSSLKKGPAGSSASQSSAKSPSGPTKLGRSEILSTVRKNQSGINQCKAKLNAGDSRVRVTIRLKIEQSGSVSSVEFLSPSNYKGSPLESCMKSRVQRFKFPAFSGPAMSIKLPFIL